MTNRRLTIGSRRHTEQQPILAISPRGWMRQNATMSQTSAPPLGGDRSQVCLVVVLHSAAQLDGGAVPQSLSSPTRFVDGVPAVILSRLLLDPAFRERDVSCVRLQADEAGLR